MKTKLLIIRHGQSLGNAGKRFLGHTDLDLTPHGYEQAEKLTEYLKNEKIDKVYSSDLIRAYHTVLGIAKQRGLEVIRDSRLREIYAGKWENKSYDELYVDFAEDYRLWKTDIGNSKCTDGETVMDLQKRIVGAVTEIAESNPGKTVCIGTHATPIRVFYSYVSNIPSSGIKDVPWATNASVTTAIYENGKMRIESYGFNEFLGNTKTIIDF